MPNEEENVRFLLLMKVYAIMQLRWAGAAVPLKSIIYHGIILVHVVE
jgi:hypothetical protein